jgi:hypothetical protein
VTTRGTSSRRLLVILAIGVALIGLNTVLPRVLFGGGDEEAMVLPRATSPAGGAAPAAGDEPSQTFETFSDENPFEPAIALPLADDGEDDGEEAAPSPSTTAPPAPRPGDADGDGFPDLLDDSDGDGLPDSLDPPTPATTAPPTTPGTTTTTVPPLPRTTEGDSSQGTIVELLELYVGDRGEVVASVRVDDEVSTVAEGERFARNFEVVSLSVADQCGEFLYGDDRFDLCVNQSLLK